jgi:hypothetical protein
MSMFPNDHAWPGELPAFLLLAGHSFEDVGITEEPAQFERGEDRQRQRWTFNPLIASVKTTLKQAQYDRFVTWYEDELRAGAARFDVRVSEQGGNRTAEWWAAQFVGPPRHEVISRETVAGHLWRISVELLLIEGPYATRTAPTLRGLAVQMQQLIAQPIVDTLLRGLATQSNTLLGRPSLPTLRGLALQSNTLLAISSDEGFVTEASEQYATESGEAFAPE